MALEEDLCRAYMRLSKVRQQFRLFKGRIHALSILFHEFEIQMTDDPRRLMEYPMGLEVLQRARPALLLLHPESRTIAEIDLRRCSSMQSRRH